MTHVSGIGYSWSDARLAVFEERTKSPALGVLLHEPGERWTYGAGTRVLGEVIEHVSGMPLEAFFASRLFGPLGMVDTSFRVPAEKRDRVATVHQRKDGKLVERPLPAEIAGTPRGDSELYSTAADYASFMRALLDEKLVSAKSMHALTTNQIGKLRVQMQPTANAGWSRPFPLGAGSDGWSLGFQIASAGGPHRRSAGSYSWAGIFNTFFWVDPHRKVASVLLTQVLPFYDERVIALLQGFEERVYALAR
jgi:CubicO group peptidase (beta-lactamase class C family)